MDRPFVIHGVRSRDSKKVQVKGVAQSREDAVKHAESLGVIVESVAFAASDERRTTALSRLRRALRARGAQRPERAIRIGRGRYRELALRYFIAGGVSCIACLAVWVSLSGTLRRPAARSSAANEVAQALIPTLPQLGVESSPLGGAAAGTATCDPSSAAAQTPVDPLPRWVPGTGHPTEPHVVAGGEYGVWIPDDGYAFVPAGELAVAWCPGKRSTEHSHISASTTEGFWRADPGYAFRKRESMDVEWTRGLRHPTLPNISAASREGQWEPDPGFNFDGASSLSVRWKPGMEHRDYPHVIAGDKAKTWMPAKGYRFSSDKPDDLTVVAKPVVTEREFARALGKCLAALATYEISKHTDDGLLGSIAREILLTTRDEALKSAMSDLFPDAPSVVLNGAVNLITQYMDGRLSKMNWASSTGVDSLAGRLRAYDPSWGSAIDGANFLGAIFRAIDQSR